MFRKVEDIRTIPDAVYFASPTYPLLPPHFSFPHTPYL